MTSTTSPPGLNARFTRSGQRVFEGGAGPPVVLLHGLSGSSANWVDVVPHLVARHRVLAVDLPGHGGSTPVPSGTGIDGFADAVAATLDERGVSDALVAGHSLGGQVALRVALRRPDLVRGLLLVAAAGITTTAPRVGRVVRLTTVVRPGRLVAPLAPRLAGYAWFRRATFRPWFVSDAAALSPRAARALLADLPRHADTRTAGRAMVGDDPRHDLDRVACPALVLWGARDPQLPVDDAFEYGRRLGAAVRLVADCGHLVVAERPAAVVDALAALAAQTGFATSA